MPTGREPLRFREICDWSPIFDQLHTPHGCRHAILEAVAVSANPETSQFSIARIPRGDKVRRTVQRRLFQGRGFNVVFVNVAHNSRCLSNT
jgi:hypothetical protein